MTNIIAYDHKGNQIELISIGKGGGEGNIYSIKEDNDKCAKIYRSDKITKELHEKIVAMVNKPPDSSLAKSVVWPDAVLYKDSKKVNS